MERSLEIKQFRNIGIYSTEKTKPERLVLNNSLEKGNMGGLVILIGPNNCGKSNVLDALKAYGNKAIALTDITTLEVGDEYHVPEIKLVTKDGKDLYYKSIKYENGKTNSYEFESIKSDYKIEEVTEISEDEKNEIINACKQTITKINASSRMHTTVSYVSQNFIRAINTFIENIINAKKIEEIKQLILDLNNSLKTTNSYLIPILAPIKKTVLFNRFIQENTVASRYQQRYGVSFTPTVYTYQSNDIQSKDLVCTADTISNSRFFNTLFSAEEQEKIKKTYASFKQHGDRYVLKELENEYGQKFDDISYDFTKMYFADSAKYKFEVYFDPDGIRCAISRNKKSVILSQQSTGFKWYFNFYFQLNKGVKLNAGDIIIMDEPATNLHPYGQTELRNHIKEYARKSNLTFVLATHSPFLIDVDNYDELRVVYMKDNTAHIVNSFTVVDHNDPDTLAPIKDALTIKQHVLYDYDEKVIFVEGISDYNYLTMFKKLLKKEKISFLPINGIGNGKEAQEIILKKLAKIGKDQPILLVDGDKAGDAMKEKAKDTKVEVISIKDIDPEFEEIESLFSKKDQEKYHCSDAHNEDYYSSYSSYIKATKGLDDFDKKTIDNFKKLFERLEE